MGYLLKENYHSHQEEPHLVTIVSLNKIAVRLLKNSFKKIHTSSLVLERNLSLITVSSYLNNEFRSSWPKSGGIKCSSKHELA